MITPYSNLNYHSAFATKDKASLAEQINQIVNQDPDLKGGLIGISIRNATNGELIYDHYGDIRLEPASNMKLLTGAVALSILGEDYRFSTEVLTDGLVILNSLEGNLYLKGKGDPTLLKSDFDKFAMDLRNKGITHIQGDLVGDDSWYDDIRYSIDLPWSDETTYYGAQISALTASPDHDYDAGTVIIEVHPSKKAGQKAVIALKPKTNYVKIINNTKTVGKKEKKNITITREHGTNTIIINGTIPVNANKVKEYISVEDPTKYALYLFRQSLIDQGIQVHGDIKVGMTPSQTTILTSHKSIPLSKLMIPFMKLSNNGHAEVLVKEMGKKVKGEGSWAKGIAVMKSELPNLNVNPETLVIRDGSGISHSDLIPANEITSLLYAIQEEEWYSTFVNSLPLAGVSEKMVGGTLRNRMKVPYLQGELRAKTGSISTVSSLSGYVKTRSGNNLIFSIIINNIVHDTKGKQIEDKICKILVGI